MLKVQWTFASTDRSGTEKLKVQWTFVSTDRSGTEKLKVQWTFVSTDRSGTKIRTRERGRVSVKKNTSDADVFFELRRARDGTRTRDPDLGKVVLHQLSHSRIINKIFISKQVMGIEPTYSAWKADVLPLNYTCVPRTGIEPVTRGFSVLCSTD